MFGVTPKNSSVSFGWRYLSRAMFFGSRHFPAITSLSLASVDAVAAFVAGDFANAFVTGSVKPKDKMPQNPQINAVEDFIYKLLIDRKTVRHDTPNTLENARCRAASDVPGNGERNSLLDCESVASFVVSTGLSCIHETN